MSTVGRQNLADDRGFSHHRRVDCGSPYKAEASPMVTSAMDTPVDMKPTSPERLRLPLLHASVSQGALYETTIRSRTR